jgi:hypothetical protein
LSPFKRLLLALTIALGGLALVPYVALPSEQLSWRLFAGAYGAGPALGVNYTSGAPGSFFSLIGFSFAADTDVTLLVNGVSLGTLKTGDTGAFTVDLATAGAEEGYYHIVARVGQSAVASAGFTLDAAAPTRPQEGDDTPLQVPPGIAGRQVFAPLVRR